MVLIFVGFGSFVSNDSDDVDKRILRSQIDTSSINLTINGETQSHSVLEQGVEDAIFIIMPDTWEYADKQSSCSYFRTETGCDTNSKVSFSLTVSLQSGVTTIEAPKYTLDPFIFAAQDHYHGGFSWTKPTWLKFIRINNQPKNSIHSYFQSLNLMMPVIVLKVIISKLKRVSLGQWRLAVHGHIQKRVLI